MKTCKLWFLLLALLMAMPMTISAAYKSDKSGGSKPGSVVDVTGPPDQVYNGGVQNAGRAVDVTGPPDKVISNNGKRVDGTPTPGSSYPGLLDPPDEATPIHPKMNPLPNPDNDGANSDRRIIPGGNDGSDSGEAQRKLGDLYFYGKNVKQDYDKALNCYRKAAEQGCDCYEVLGDLYAVKHDYTEATKWYQKAADKNNDEAQLKLGLCYATGKGVKQSFSEAAKQINGWIKGMSLANLAGVTFIIFFILFIILFHFALFNGKRLGLSKRIILAFTISASLSITLCLCFSFMISLSDLLPLIASDFFMFYVFSIFFIFCFGLITLGLTIVYKAIKRLFISAESKNETSEDTLMDGKKGHKVNFYIANGLIISFATLVFAFLVGVPYYWFVTKALGHEPLSPFALDLEDKDSAIIIGFLIFFVALTLGCIVSLLIQRLVWGWRNTSIRKTNIMIGTYETYSSKPLKKSRYIKGLIFPFFILGILPLLVSPFVNSFGMCLLGIMFIGVTSDFFMYVWKLRKEPRDCMIQDIKGEYAVFVLDENQPADNK